MSGEINIVLCGIFLLMRCTVASCLAKIAPADVPAGLTVVYGFAPRLKLGNDHRIGFGFRFGNHADFQILYEFGPQTTAKSSKTVSKARAITYRQPAKKPRRRPFIELLIRTGLLREVERVENHKYNAVRPTNVTKSSITYNKNRLN